MTTAAETFSLDTLFTATVNGTAYAIVSDEYNSFIVPAAALEQDVDDDGEDAYTAWCEAARVDDKVVRRMFVLSAAVDAVHEAAQGRGLVVTQAEVDAIAAARSVNPAWLAKSACHHYAVTVATAVEADLITAAMECKAATDVYGVTDACDVQNFADKHGVCPTVIAETARSLGIPVLG